MKYWLIKSEPSTYSWDDFCALGRDHWDGVRNYAARNNMKAMKEGDICIFYHSVKDPGAVGLAKVVKEFYPDPTTDDDRWVVVDLIPLKQFEHKVTLKQVKSDARLSEIELVKNTRLSVQTMPKPAYDIILGMAGELREPRR